MQLFKLYTQNSIFKPANTNTCYTSLANGVQLHLQSGEQSRFALAHLQLGLSPLQAHLISSLHDLETSGIVTQTGTHESDSLIQAKSCGDGTTGCASVLDVQMPA